MKKTITILDKIISKISIYFLVILFAVIIIGMLLVNSVYLYVDKPDFKINNSWNYLGIIMNLAWIVFLVIGHNWLEKKYPNKKYINKIMMLLYLIGEIIFLKLVPIKPFSDMLQVTDIALSNFKNKIEYLQVYPNNLPIAIVFNLIFRITTYDVFVLKIVNILCNIITIYFAYKIYQNIYQKENKMVLILGICSVSTFLYVNHIYNDVIYVALTTSILYLVTKKEQNVKEVVLISILAFLQFVIRPVGIILNIAIGMYYILKRQEFKKVLTIFSIFLVLEIGYLQVEKSLIPESEEKMKFPIWSFIQMGINEEEFGFQDASHSTKWTFADVKDRIVELGPFKLIKLLGKKQYWLWTEGTYQVQRYAFGVEEGEQFFYETPATKLVCDTQNSKVRKALEYFMKGQYFVLIVLSFIDVMIREDKKEIKDKKEILFYLIIGLFCFYTIWEMKSRYIYCLYPIFLILATSGIEKIKIKKERRTSENGKF